MKHRIVATSSRDIFFGLIESDSDGSIAKWKSTHEAIQLTEGAGSRAAETAISVGLLIEILKRIYIQRFATCPSADELTAGYTHCLMMTNSGSPK